MKKAILFLSFVIFMIGCSSINDKQEKEIKKNIEANYNEQAEGVRITSAGKLKILRKQVTKDWAGQRTLYCYEGYLDNIKGVVIREIYESAPQQKIYKPGEEIAHCKLGFTSALMEEDGKIYTYKHRNGWFLFPGDKIIQSKEKDEDYFNNFLSH